MRDVLHDIAKWLDHNRYVTVFIVIAVAVLFAVSCQPQAVSPFSAKEVTMGELNAEVTLAEATLTAKAEALEAEYGLIAVKAEPAYAEIEREQAMIAALINQGTQAAAQYGGTAWGPLLGGLGALGAVFFGLDNRRKDKQLNGK